AGHDLTQKDKPLLERFDYVVNGLAAYIRHETIDNPMPKLSWRHEDQDGKWRITVQSSPAPTGGRVWVAKSGSRDFRKTAWVEHPATLTNGQLVGLVDPPTNGFQACFAELDYEMDEIKFHLSTQIRIAPAK